MKNFGTAKPDHKEKDCKLQDGSGTGGRFNSTLLVEADRQLLRLASGFKFNSITSEPITAQTFTILACL